MKGLRVGAIDGAPKELRKVLITAEQLGCVVKLTGSNHFQVRCPSGGVVHISQTPRSMGNCLRNVRRDLKREGILV